MQAFHTIGTVLHWATARLNRDRMLCPSCGGESKCVLDRRFVFLTLAECRDCTLYFRQPTDAPEESYNYYQEEYHDPRITEIPTRVELSQLTDSKFSNKFNRSAQVNLVRHLTGPGRVRVLDYGCSWGYAMWQYLDDGFAVEGFELGEARANFAAKWLEVPVHTKAGQLEGPYNAIIASHVLEHVPALSPLLNKLKAIIQPGGYFISLTPNANLSFRKTNAKLWSQLWGNRHPLFIHSNYLARQFSGWQTIALTRSAFQSETFPLNANITEEAFKSSTIFDQTGDELIFIAKKPNVS